MVALHITSDRWPAISALLDEALELPPHDRDAWLAALDGERAALRDTLRELLAGHADAERGGFLGTLPSIRGSAAAGAGPLAPGASIGPYRLVAELGHGGMGAVWLAERADGAYVRRVALKLPLATRLRSDLAARFVRERDILARLEHPHIARLYDAGFDADGLPYLAMEYVEGRAIDDACDADRLDVRARIALFVQVLEAVQYAHSRLVIHRDLKPSNILVAADGQVRLLDFGIAKLLGDDGGTHDTELTRLGGRALTPDYASPEQVKGETLGIASDIYSLGVVLYGLLAGQRPYRLTHVSPAQLEQAIVGADPPRPSSVVDADAATARRTAGAKALARALAGDLDTIVLKALAKSPDDRYATAAAFADDLRRHLQGLPVLAQPASWRYRLRKGLARHRIAVAAGGAVALALIAGTAVSLWQAGAARAQAQRADEVKRFVLSIFQDADSGRGGGRKTTAAELLRQARERLAAAGVADAAIRTELLTSIGFSLLGLGEYQQAAPVLAEAAQLAAQTLGARDAATLGAQLAHGEALVTTNQPDAALPVLDAAEAGMTAIGDAVGRMQAVRWKSHLEVMRGRYDDAITHAQRAVALADALPANDAARRARMDAYLTLANTLYIVRRPGRLAAADKAYALAREIHGTRVSAPLLDARSIRGTAMVLEGDAEQGFAELRAALAQQVELLGADHGNVGLTHNRLGFTALMRGDPLTAAASLREIVRINTVNSGGKPGHELALQHFNLGTALMAARRHADAETHLREAARQYATLLEPSAFHVVNVRSAIALLLARTGRLQESDAAFAELLAQPIANPVQTALAKQRLAVLRRAQGRQADAGALLAEAMPVFEQGPLKPQLASAQLDLALLALARDDAAAALAPLERARSLYAEVHPAGSPDAADVQIALARAKLAAGDAAAAAGHAAQAAAFWRRYDATNASLGRALLWQLRAAPTSRDAGALWREASTLLGSDASAEERALLAATKRVQAGT